MDQGLRPFTKYVYRKATVVDYAWQKAIRPKIATRLTQSLNVPN